MNSFFLRAVSKRHATYGRRYLSSLALRNASRNPEKQFLLVVTEESAHEIFEDKNIELRNLIANSKQLQADRFREWDLPQTFVFFANRENMALVESLVGNCSAQQYQDFLL